MGLVDGLTLIITGAVAGIGRATAFCFASEGAQVEGKVALYTMQPKDKFDAVMSVNLKGALLCLKAKITAMLMSGGGNQTSAEMLGQLQPMRRIGTAREVKK